MASGKFRSKSKKIQGGGGDHDPAQCPHQLNGKYIHYKPEKATEGKEIIRTFDLKGTRELIVPKRDVIEIPGIMPQSEFERLKNQAHVLTLKDKIGLIDDAEQRRIKLEKESEARKQFLKKAQLHQRPKPGSKLNDVEDEAANKNQSILQRAFELRQEQEDEVKKANSLILATKCMAIRQAQIAEKELIRTELQEEERRLDMMMEQDRQKSLQRQQAREKKQKQRTDGFIQQIKQQIKENDILRLLQAERKEEEARLANKAMIALKMDEIEMLNQKHKQRMKTNADLKKANEDIRRYKLIQEEEQKIADSRVMEFMRKKQEREDARETELLAIKKQKETEIIRLREMQERAQDQQAIKDELNARRIQEEMEKVWRDNERTAAIKRKAIADDMRIGRQHQIEDMRRVQALKLSKDEEDFHKVAQVQLMMHEKDIEEKHKRHEAAYKHRQELLQQVNKKERNRINLIMEKFHEGGDKKIEEELHQIRIKEALNRKIEYLTDNNVPDNYIQDIRRQLNLKD